MRILFLQQQPCIRALKYAEGLKNVRSDITLYFAYRGKTLTELYGHGDELFQAWYPLDPNPEECLSKILSRHRIDLVHSHNAPDTLTNLYIELFRNGPPIIHDIHDLMSIRQTAYEDGFKDTVLLPGIEEMEQSAIEGSDAVIAVSTEIMDIIQRHYQIPDLSCTYSNYIPKRFVPSRLPDLYPLNGAPLQIVYEGFLSNNSSHYDLEMIFRSIAKQGIHIHIYPSRENPSYKELADRIPNIYYHHHLPPQDLFNEITQYDLGWAGFNNTLNHAHIDTVMPNKVFEYIACGLPVVTFPHKSLKRFIDTQDLGVVVDNIDALGDVLSRVDFAALKRRVRAKRHDFTVEANISHILDIYTALV